MVLGARPYHSGPPQIGVYDLSSLSSKTLKTSNLPEEVVSFWRTGSSFLVTTVTPLRWRAHLHLGSPRPPEAGPSSRGGGTG